MRALSMGRCYRPCRMCCQWAEQLREPFDGALDATRLRLAGISTEAPLAQSSLLWTLWRGFRLAGVAAPAGIPGGWLGCAAGARRNTCPDWCVGGPRSFGAGRPL